MLECLRSRAPHHKTGRHTVHHVYRQHYLHQHDRHTLHLQMWREVVSDRLKIQWMELRHYLQRKIHCGSPT